MAEPSDDSLASFGLNNEAESSLSPSLLAAALGRSTSGAIPAPAPPSSSVLRLSTRAEGLHQEILRRNSFLQDHAASLPAAPYTGTNISLQPLTANDGVLYGDGGALTSLSPSLHHSTALGHEHTLTDWATSSRLTTLADLQQQQRRLSLENEAFIISEAYRRGREEAILSLLRNNDSLFGARLNQEADETPVVLRPIVQDKNSVALETLGTTGIERRKKNAPYFDASTLEDPDPNVATRRNRGGVTEPFPEKLHRLLKDAEQNGETDVVCFLPHGRAFAIHKVERFCREIMPRYFRQSRLSSFQRQLNLYGFTRIATGPDAGGYYHELFLKGRPALAMHMRRVGVPQAAGLNQRPVIPRRTSSISATPTTAPDFYSMDPIKEA